MIEQQAGFILPKPYDYPFPRTFRNGHLPSLNKVQAFDHTIYCGYSNGLLLQYRYSPIQRNFQFNGKFHPYQNTDIIDLDLYDSDVILTCTHNQVSLYNLTKNKSMPLKGHESTPYAVSAHPVSPYVVSLSNALIEHDVRMRKPINVNFLTPPAFDVEFFPDGKEYVVSGQPVRIGRSSWVRSLNNGMAKPSITGKHVLTNDMNGSISLWDWRQSQKLMSIESVNNHETYQPVHFGLKDGTISDILFLQDNGMVLKYDFGKRQQGNRRVDRKVVDVGPQENWKMTTRTVQNTTKSLILYEHSRATMRIYDLY